MSQISHKSDVLTSQRTLEILEGARRDPYPKNKKIKNPPLSFDLDIRERVPTPEELTELLYMAESPSYLKFLREPTRSFKEHPTSAQSLHDLLQEDANLMRWPILVNYGTKQITFDRAGVTRILRSMVEKKDGEPIPPPSSSRPVRMPRPPSPSTAWIDYD
jgi:arsenate reductase-like glutaredoxin family protein